MNITAIFIRRPVMTILVMMGFIIFGVVGYRTLPVSDLPAIDFPTIQVSASLPGASPETMASSVAMPIERQLSTVPGLDSMTSSSGRGSTSITLQFSLDRDLDAAAQDVQSAIAAVSRRLPRDMPAPPTMQKVNPADQAVLFMALTSKTVSPQLLNEYAETMLAPKMSSVNGVAQVNVMGSGKFAVRIQLDPNKLAARGVGVDDITSAVSRHNVNLPTGTLWGPQQAFTVQPQGQIMNAAGFRPLILTYRAGNPVRLEDVANVFDGIQNDKSISWFNNERAIAFTVQRQPGTNTVEVVDRVKALLPEFRQQLPPAVNFDIVYDRTQSIRESVDDVKMSLLLAVGLVILVIFLFLRNISATIIPSLALPLSVVGTFAIMALFGYSLDNLSLMALTLAVGFVVDDAIVALENIVRHMEMGKSRLEAALEGGREIGFTILSMTISLAAVFIPVLFMGGIIGRLFHEFAVVIMTAIIISGIVSISLTPMLCSRILKPPTEHHNALYRATESVFQAALAVYRWALNGAIRFKFVTILVTAGTVAATVYFYGLVPKGFIPNQDTGGLSGSVEFAQDASFESMSKIQQQVSKVISEDPNISSFYSSVSAGGGGGGSYGGGGGNSGRMQIRLKPTTERKLTPEQVIDELRPKLAGIPGARVFLQNPPLIRIGGYSSRSVYQYTLQSQDLGELYRSSAEFEKRIRELPGITDVSSDMMISSPQLTLDIDRNRASALGVSADQIESALFSSYGSRQISSIFTPTNDYQVILEMAPQFQRDPSALNLLRVRSNTGRLIQIDAVTTAKTTVAPLTITHLAQLPSVTISFNLAPGVALGDAVDRVSELATRTLPDTMHTTFQGAAAAFQSSLAGMGMLLALAVLVIYMVLGILYESFIHPLTILSGLPSAGLGALATLYLFKDELNIYSFVGVIMLVGIVKKNGIMMIDFALESQRAHNVTPEAAIFEACIVRFRPIMMTSMAAMAGTLPIALGLGAGGEARRPLGLAVVGGLAVSQALTLFLTPVIYIYMEKTRTMFSRSKKKQGRGETTPSTVSHQLS